jgi:hypothetical protein
MGISGGCQTVHSTCRNSGVKRVSFRRHRVTGFNALKPLITVKPGHAASCAGSPKTVDRFVGAADRGLISRLYHRKKQFQNIFYIAPETVSVVLGRAFFCCDVVQNRLLLILGYHERPAWRRQVFGKPFTSPREQSRPIYIRFVVTDNTR